MTTKAKYEPCPSCTWTTINGIFCHETGCPDNHLNTFRDCKWCGSEFEPQYKPQQFCDDECMETYYS